MTGLFERAAGEAWNELHPQIRERYGLVASERRRAVGTGEMSRLTRTPLAVPILRLAAADDFLFPERGTGVPFTITTQAFVDQDGHEALFLERRFETEPRRTFVDTLRWNPERNCVTDLLGRHGRVAADLYLDAEGDALSLSLGTQWLRLRGRYLSLPGPLAVDATLRDRYDDDADEFRVEADVRNPLVGRVFGYQGRFENEFRTVGTDISTDSALGSVDLPGVNA